MGVPEWDEATGQTVAIELPDWYLAIRAARYGGVPVTDALGLPWGPTIEAWCLMAEAAEQEAEAELVKQAHRRAEAERKR